MTTQLTIDDVTMDNISDTGQHRDDPDDIDIDFDEDVADTANQDYDMDGDLVEEVKDDEMHDEINLDIDYDDDYHDEVLLDVENTDTRDEFLNTNNNPSAAQSNSIDLELQDQKLHEEQEPPQQEIMSNQEDIEQYVQDDSVPSQLEIEEKHEARPPSNDEPDGSESGSEAEERQKSPGTSDRLKEIAKPSQESTESLSNDARPENTLDSVQTEQEDQPGRHNDKDTTQPLDLAEPSTRKGSRSTDASRNKDRMMTSALDNHVSLADDFTLVSPHGNFPVVLCCSEGELNMFPEPGRRKDGASALLEDESLLRKPLQNVFRAIRDCFQEGCDPGIEFTFRIPSLGITISDQDEYTKEEGCTLDELVNLYLVLNFNDDNLEPGPLHLDLELTEVFYARYRFLRQAAKEKKGLSQASPFQYYATLQREVYDTAAVMPAHESEPKHPELEGDGEATPKPRTSAGTDDAQTLVGNQNDPVDYSNEGNEGEVAEPGDPESEAVVEPETVENDEEQRVYAESDAVGRDNAAVTKEVEYASNSPNNYHDAETDEARVTQPINNDEVPRVDDQADVYGEGSSLEKESDLEDDLIDWNDDESEPQPDIEATAGTTAEADQETEPAQDSNPAAAPTDGEADHFSDGELDTSAVTVRSNDEIEVIPNDEASDRPELNTDAPNGSTDEPDPVASPTSTPDGGQQSSAAKRTLDEFEDDVIDFSDSDDETPSKRLKTTSAE